MNFVGWYDAAAYCNWLSKEDGIPVDEWCYSPNEKGDYAEGMKLMSNAESRKGYRLPSEAEWEFSCRAGTAASYSFGEPWELLEKYVWYVKNSANKTQPVGSLKPNDYGLFDLHGNVWEWCQDRYKEAGNKGMEVNIAQSITGKDPRVLRGGSFYSQPANVRSAVRGRLAPSNRGTNIGFRLARTYP
jgi:formylglycine-generating enzyme required for sulfatase activity